MMAKIKKTKFIILGFLLNKSLSGYEIGGLIKQSTDHFWQESDASIYPTLKLLANEQLVSFETVYVGKKRKDIFTITDAGKKAFMEWFKIYPDKEVHRAEFLLKLFFTNESTEEHMYSHCREKLQELKKMRQEYKKIEKTLKQETPEKGYWLKTLQVGLAHLELDISWMSSILQK